MCKHSSFIQNDIHIYRTKMYADCGKMYNKWFKQNSYFVGKNVIKKSTTCNTNIYECISSYFSEYEYCMLLGSVFDVIILFLVKKKNVLQEEDAIKHSFDSRNINNNDVRFTAPRPCHHF